MKTFKCAHLLNTKSINVQSSLYRNTNMRAQRGVCIYPNTNIYTAVQCIVFNNEKLVAEKLSVQYDLIIIFKNCNVYIKRNPERYILLIVNTYEGVKGFNFYCVVSELQESLIMKIYYFL